MNLYRDPFGIVPIVEPVVSGMGYQFWGLDCQTGRHTAQVRVYIDGDKGVTLDDCSQVSEQLSAVLDVEDPIHMPYTLEISSPGINRLLFSIDQMQDAVGSKVRIKTSWPIEGRRNFNGFLEGVEPEHVRIRMQDDASFQVPLNAVRNVKLDVDIEFSDQA